MCRKGKRADAPRDADGIGPVQAKAGRGRFVLRLSDIFKKARDQNALDLSSSGGKGFWVSRMKDFSGFFCR
jgi:hypothetical protein